VTLHVLAGDPSLTSFGAATITNTSRVDTYRRGTDPLPCRQGHLPCRDKPKHLPDLLDVHARVRSQARWFCDLVTAATVLVVLEGPAYGALHGQPDERAGLRWLILNWVIRREIPVALIPPSTVKGYLTGRGNASKDDMRRAVAALYPRQGLSRVSHDEADAVGCALAGADFLGWDGPWLDGRRGSAVLSKIQWPDRDTIREAL
jgi:hypothetical protein